MYSEYISNESILQVTPSIKEIESILNIKNDGEENDISLTLKA